VLLQWKTAWQFLKNYIKYVYYLDFYFYIDNIQKLESRKLNKYFHTNIHSSTSYKVQEVQRTCCPTTDGWMNKMCNIHKLEYYSTLVKLWNILQHMKLENIMKFKKSDTKGKYCVISLIWDNWNNKHSWRQKSK
jgi:hypothetical protein